jgi:cleavage and polyadenylation specificity factor subunit 1
MSLIEYSEQNLNIQTTSMHYFEKEDFRKDITLKGKPLVQVDPDSRCAIMKFYENHFAILPMKSDDDDGLKVPFLPSFVIKESEIDGSIKNIIDFKFLYGFLEPTLAILYEPEQTFAGRLAFRKDSVSIIVISLDLFQKKYPVLFKVDGLPYNCTHMMAVPSPVGGIVIFSHNAVIHLDQTNTPGFAAIVNPFFDMESHFKPIPTDDGTPMLPVKNKPASVYIRYGKTSDCKALGISLDGSRAVFMSPDIMLLVLRTGDMYRIDLIGDDGAGRSWKRKRSGVKDIKIKNLGLNMALPSILINLSNLSQYTKPQILGSIFQMDEMMYYSNFFFAASMATDATLIQFVEPIEDTVKEEVFETMDVDLEDDLDEELYGGSTIRMKSSKAHSIESKIKFRVCDMIMNVGPLSNMAVGEPAPYSDQEYSGEPVGSHLEVVGCGGFDTYGSLVVLHRTIRPHIISSFSLGKINDIWSVPVHQSDNPEDNFNKYLLISRNNGTNVTFSFNLGLENW